MDEAAGGDQGGWMARAFAAFKRKKVYIIGAAVVGAVGGLVGAVSSAAKFSADAAYILKLAGIDKPYYSICEGDSCSSQVHLPDGARYTFALQGGYYFSNVKILLFGVTCKWSAIIPGGKPRSLPEPSCTLPSDSLAEDVAKYGSLTLSVRATDPFNRKLRGADGSDAWSIQVTNNSSGPSPSLPPTEHRGGRGSQDRIVSGTPQTNFGSTLQASPRPSDIGTHLGHVEAVMMEPPPHGLEAVLENLANARDYDRFDRLGNQWPEIKQAGILTVQDVLKLLQGIQVQRLRLSAIRSWFLPLLKPPFSVADAKLLLLGLDGADQNELLLQLHPCIKDTDSVAVQDILLEGLMGEEWEDRKRALDTTSTVCLAGNLLLNESKKD